MEWLLEDENIIHTHSIEAFCLYFQTEQVFVQESDLLGLKQNE